jgi:opacity protein-like surface antigen
MTAANITKRKMQKLKQAIAVSGITAMTWTTISWAAEPGWYISGSVGASILTDSGIEISSPDFPDFPPVEGEFKYNVGPSVAGAVGYGFSRNVRLEGEIGYRTNNFDTLRAEGEPPIPVDDRISALSFMANLFYDFETHSPWKPYLGGGIGGARVAISEEGDTVFAWQVGAGLGYAITPQFAVSLDYRYFATADPQFSVTEYIQPSPLQIVPVNVDINTEYASHNVGLSLRYRF